MFRHTTIEINELKKNYIANYNYAENTEFNWDTELLGGIDAEDINSLNSQLQNNETVTRLNLSRSRIGKNDTLVDSLSQLLQDNPHVEYVNLANNELADQHIIRMAKGLNIILLKYIHLDLANNPNITPQALNGGHCIQSAHPLTIISLLSNNNEKASETVLDYLNTAQADLTEQTLESQKHKEEKERYLNNPNNYSTDEFYWNVDKLGDPDRFDLEKLNIELKKYKSIIRLSFNTCLLGRRGGTIDVLVNILRDNPQINFIDLEKNMLQDRHIQKIIDGLTPLRLKNLLIRTNVNWLTEKSFQLASRFLDSLSVISMEFGNRINHSNPEVIECSNKAREEGRKKRETIDKPLSKGPTEQDKLNKNSMFSLAESSTSQPKHLADSAFDEKTNQQTNRLLSPKNKK